MDEATPKRFITSRSPEHAPLIAALAGVQVGCLQIQELADLRSVLDPDALQVLFLDSHLLEHGVDSRSIAAFVGSGVVVAAHPPFQDNHFDQLDSNWVWAHVRTPYQTPDVVRMIDSAFEYLASRRETTRAIAELNTYSHKLQELNRIGVALSTERDHDALLELILCKCREVTEADAGSLYLVQDTPSKEKILRFKLSQNDSFNLSYKEFTMPISSGSIAGYVALSGTSLNLRDVYDLPPDSAYRFDRNWDQMTGYRTKSMLVVPMKNRNNETIGIIQLINRKRHWEARVTDADAIEREIVPFDSWSEELINSLASQAAVALENNILYTSIHDLFEGFVKASVTAIESRDPTTSGHSSRVAELTVGLAQVVDRTAAGRFAPLSFSRAQIQEIRYASLLHDFGKVGVREEVLIKAKKCYPEHLERIKSRFAFVRKGIEADYANKKLEFVLARGKEEYLASLPKFQEDLHSELDELDRCLQFVIEANEPTVLEDGNFTALLEIAKRTYLDSSGLPGTLLVPEEVGFLSIRRGSLDSKERLEIESHVTHTYRFLSQIPWTNELRDVPAIAYAHHEKLDGTGYPNQLHAEDIPIQSRMMTVADIFDALTASDRPYKKAVPLEKALDILEFESKGGKIDSELLKLFIEAKVYDLVLGNPSAERVSSSR
ncbi:MAG: GAF domain-containing protein [Cyanobacteria bacterium REEB65]|nr:GAF domain-containing protein [Cyanobacteria bacterium REEB65]